MPSARGLEPVERLLRDDVDVVAVVDRERVLDHLAEVGRASRAPVAGSSVPTSRRWSRTRSGPDQSGSAEMILSPTGHDGREVVVLLQPSDPSACADHQRWRRWWGGPLGRGCRGRSSRRPRSPVKRFALARVARRQVHRGELLERARVEELQPGRLEPTQIVTIRPLESNVTEAQSPAGRVGGRRLGIAAERPRPRLVSVWNASEWMLLRPLGAMNGVARRRRREDRLRLTGAAMNSGEPAGVLQDGPGGPGRGRRPRPASEESKRRRARRMRNTLPYERARPNSRPPRSAAWSSTCASATTSRTST